MALYIVNNSVNSCVSKTYASVSTAVVNSNSACLSVAKCCAWECYVLNVAYALIDLSWVDEILAASVLNLPWLLLVKDAS